METVRSFRYSEYLNRRTHYFSIVEYQKCGVFKTSQSSTTGGRSTDASGGEGWFSALDDPEFYNEMPSPDVQTITEFFNSYIEERDNELDNHLSNITISDVISFDSTFHVQKTTKVKNSNNSGFSAVDEDAALFVLNGTGEVIDQCNSKGETAATLIPLLRGIKNRRLEQGKTDNDVFYVFCDNAMSWEVTIKSVFPNAKVGQDGKHLVNRLVECCSKTHPLYGEFTADLHAAFFGKETIPVYSRDGQVYKIPARLDHPEVIITRVERKIAAYKLISQGLLKPEFDACWETQKPQITKSIFDGLQDGNQAHICFQIYVLTITSI